MNDPTYEELVNDLLSLPHYKDWSRLDIDRLIYNIRKDYGSLPEGVITNDQWIDYLYKRK